MYGFSLYFLSGSLDIAYVSDACSLLVKGKAIPLQAWSGPEEGSRRLRLPDFKRIGT